MEGGSGINGSYDLTVSDRPGPAGDVMSVDLCAGANPTNPGLPRLGGDLEAEYWQAPDGQLCGFGLAVPDDPSGDPAAVAEGLYAELIERLRASEFAYPLRLWNYFPAINSGAGDRERYRRFCVGRGRALEVAGLADARMCAATAIGTTEPVMRLIALAGRYPGVSIENPRQVSAWNYPAEYGPRSPAFARATAIGLAGGRAGLLISGTASVVGHATAHPGDCLAQAEEAADNLQALLETAAAQLRRPQLARFNSSALARVYIRNPEHWPAVEACLRGRWPGLKFAGLKGDICRSDLLVEIEAWHCG